MSEGPKRFGVIDGGLSMSKEEAAESMRESMTRLQAQIGELLAKLEINEVEVPQIDPLSTNASAIKDDTDADMIRRLEAHVTAVEDILEEHEEPENGLEEARKYLISDTMFWVHREELATRIAKYQEGSLA